MNIMTAQTLEQMIEADADRAAPADTLENIKRRVRETYATILRLKELEEAVAEASRERKKLEHEVLPGLLIEAGMPSVPFDADGNYPALEAKMSDFYRANIPVDWPVEKRQAAFETLQRLGLGDIVRLELRLTFDRGDYESVRKAVKFLSETLSPKVAGTSVSETVPWQTLSAAIREYYESGKFLTDEDKIALGAMVGKIVRIKEIKP